VAESDSTSQSGTRSAYRPDRFSLWRELCSRCGRIWSLADRRWRCSCEGLLDLLGPQVDPIDRGATGTRSESSLERYRAALPPGAGDVDLGLDVTPLLPVAPEMWVKCEFEHPTGSFKDRGASVMIGAAAALGVDAVIVDSSGNAGRAVAAHAAAASMAATVYVPAGTDAAKLAAIAGYGASVVEVPGDRAATAESAQRRADGDAIWYASHVHQPLFHHGVKTLAYEIFEQLPDPAGATVVVPAGNGTLVLGLWLGFAELVAARRLVRPPVVVAVQAERCAPLTGRPPVADDPPTAAAGVAIPAPPRAAQIRAAALGTGGGIVTVKEEDILSAREELGRMGLAVEVTGAVAWAAIRASRPTPARSEGAVVAVLTGR